VYHVTQPSDVPLLIFTHTLALPSRVHVCHQYFGIPSDPHSFLHYPPHLHFHSKWNEEITKIKHQTHPIHPPPHFPLSLGESSLRILALRKTRVSRKHFIFSHFPSCMVFGLPFTADTIIENKKKKICKSHWRINIELILPPHNSTKLWYCA